MIVRFAAAVFLTTILLRLADVPARGDLPAGFEPLYNGCDLTGWHGLGHFDPRKLAEMSREERAAKRDSDLQDMREHWRIENGEIVNDGHGVFLTTDRDYGDICLLLEYKTVPLADSGIYLRGSPQVQIWDATEASKSRKHGSDRGSGGLWNNSPGAPGKDPLMHADRPFGEWNKLRVRQIGARTSVWFNECLVVDHAIMENYWDRGRPLFATGPIQLQTHGGEIRWRNLWIREITVDEANQILAERHKEKFTSIFNGCDFQGWIGSLDDYQVREGALLCKPEKGGNIFTEQEYSDFVVRLEFKLPAGGNNGLAIRYPGSGDPAYDAMCELQVLDNTSEKYKNLDPRQLHGSAYGMAAADRGYLRAVGDWNFQEVAVDGSNVRVELNGYVILDADLSSATSFLAERSHPGKDRQRGHFGFAGHSDPVKFRNISIRELGEP